MYDLLKVIIANILMPLPVILVLMIISSLLFYKACHKLAAITSLIAIFALFFLSWAPVTDLLISKYERQYPPFETKQVDKPAAIMVLGGGWYPYDTASNNNLLSDSSLGRLIEALRIANLYPDAKLVVSGTDRNPEIPAMATAYAKVAADMGIDPERIVILDTPTDTGKEATAYKDWATTNDLLDEPVILVTSASHLPRSVKHFQAENIKAIPAPAHYLSHPQEHNLTYWIPSAKNLHKTERFWYEFLADFVVNLEH